MPKSACVPFFLLSFLPFFFLTILPVWSKLSWKALFSHFPRKTLIFLYVGFFRCFHIESSLSFLWKFFVSTFSVRGIVMHIVLFIYFFYCIWWSIILVFVKLFFIWIIYYVIMIQFFYYRIFLNLNAVYCWYLFYLSW